MGQTRVANIQLGLTGVVGVFKVFCDDWTTVAYQIPKDALRTKFYIDDFNKMVFIS